MIKVLTEKMVSIVEETMNLARLEVVIALVICYPSFNAVMKMLHICIYVLCLQLYKWIHT